jgi:hypothetical protein
LAFVIELHLSVPPPIGKVCKGNHYRHGYDEHLLTLQRVIVAKENSCMSLCCQYQGASGRLQGHGAVRRRNEQKCRSA